MPYPASTAFDEFLLDACDAYDGCASVYGLLEPRVRPLVLSNGNLAAAFSRAIEAFGEPLSQQADAAMSPFAQGPLPMLLCPTYAEDISSSQFRDLVSRDWAILLAAGQATLPQCDANEFKKFDPETGDGSCVCRPGRVCGQHPPAAPETVALLGIGFALVAILAIGTIAWQIVQTRILRQLSRVADGYERVKTAQK